MKKILTAVFCLALFSGISQAKTDLNVPEIILNKKDITVLEKGESFNYPLEEGKIIECYAKKIDGSIDEYNEYNDYFVMRNGHLYSNTTHRLYKPNKKDKLKKVDQARVLADGKTLKMYDPLWEASVRHHMRGIKINIQTGEYYMKGTQDNWMWYRNITTSGYCRVMN